jgi:hypothetical protein
MSHSFISTSQVQLSLSGDESMEITISGSDETAFKFFSQKTECECKSECKCK